MRKSLSLQAMGSALLVVGVAALTACGGGGGGDKKSDPAPAPTETGATETPDNGGGGGSGGGAPANTDLVLAGSLNLIGSGNGANLTGPSFGLAATDGYDIYCVTFEDDPLACKAEIDSAGAFDKTCADYAGKAFGCFLRKDNKTVGDIVFDQGGDEDEDSQLVAGAGTLKVAVNFDPELGVATAVVDKEASSALAADKIAEMKAIKGADDTSLPNMTGTYAIECLGVEDETGAKMPCPAGEHGGGAPESIFLNEWAKDGKRRVSIWSSEAAKNSCLGAANNELRPEFRIKVGNNDPVLFDVSNLQKYREGYSSVIAQFANDYPVAFGNLLDSTGTDWEVQHCRNQEANQAQAQDAFSDATCMIVAPQVEQFTFWDPEQKREVTRWEPKWVGSWGEARAANAERGFDEANIQAVEQQCFNYLVSESRPDMPPCPPHLVEPFNGSPSTEATLTFTVYDYVAGDQRSPVDFVCKDPNSQQTGDDAPLIRFPVVAKGDAASYKAAALANITSNNNAQFGDPGCAKVDLDEVFPGVTGSLASRQIYKNHRRVIMRTFGELLRSSKDEGYNVCQDFSPRDASALASFNFETSCQQGGGPLCWESRWMLEDLGMRIADTGDSISSTDQDPFEWSNPGTTALCRAAGMTNQAQLDTLNSFGPSQNQDFDAWRLSKINAKKACRTLFLNLSGWGAKMDALQDAVLSPDRMPPSIALQCGGDQPSRDAIAALTENSCMPELDIDTRCEQGNCTEVLRCWGTADGKCVDADGNYAGRVPGRFEDTALKLRIGGAFEMSSLSIETWNQWTGDGEQVCKAARSFKLAGTKLADTQFDGRLTFGDNVVCEGGDDTSDPNTQVGSTGPAMPLNGPGTGPDTAVEGGGDQGSEKRDPPMYLRFTKQ